VDRTWEQAVNQSGGALMRARELRKEYGRGEGLVRAVDNIGLEMASTPPLRSQLRDSTGQGRLRRTGEDAFLAYQGGYL
jgi:hypothetical protein